MRLNAKYLVLLTDYNTKINEIEKKTKKKTIMITVISILMNKNLIS